MEKIILLPKNKSIVVKQQKEREEFIDEELLKLKKATLGGTICKGVRETVKNIEGNKCRKVFLSTDAEEEIYKKTIKDICDLYNVPLIEVNSKYLIRDTIMLGVPSQEIIRQAKMKGKIPKIMPNCYVVGVIDYGAVNLKFSTDD